MTADHSSCVPLKEHLDEMQGEREKFQTERDRRYLEVNIEKEKALKIKETADLAALSLAREIQDYKDEKANNLRSQIEGERGDYATKAEIKPISDWVVAQAGVQRGSSSAVSWVVTGISVVVSLILVYLMSTGK